MTFVFFCFWMNNIKSNLPAINSLMISRARMFGGSPNLSLKGFHYFCFHMHYFVELVFYPLRIEFQDYTHKKTDLNIY